MVVWLCFFVLFLFFFWSPCPRVQQCKDKLVTAVNESLAGLPTLPMYLSNLTDWFNCTKLGETSSYSRKNLADVCLARPPVGSGPGAPPRVGAVQR